MKKININNSFSIFFPITSTLFEILEVIKIYLSTKFIVVIRIIRGKKLLFEKNLNLLKFTIFVKL